LLFFNLFLVGIKASPSAELKLSKIT
jgi:hypothetical protein